MARLTVCVFSTSMWNFFPLIVLIVSFTMMLEEFAGDIDVSPKASRPLSCARGKQGELGRARKYQGFIRIIVFEEGPGIFRGFVYRERRELSAVLA